jgi:hypothetical protein
MIKATATLRVLTTIMIIRLGRHTEELLCKSAITASTWNW